MKYGLIVLLLVGIALAGCKKQDTTADNVAQNNENLMIETDYVKSVDGAHEETTEAYEPGTWISDANLAMIYAKELNRPVLMNFTGSDWCPWCFKLRDEVFAKDAFIKYARESLVLLTVDFPRKKTLPKNEQAANDALAGKYGIDGFPTIVLTDHDGNEINRASYQPGGADAYVKHLKGLLNKK